MSLRVGMDQPPDPDDELARRRAERARQTLGPQFACMDPIILEARFAYWANPGPGHYPGCACERCDPKAKPQRTSLLSWGRDRGAQ